MQYQPTAKAVESFWSRVDATGDCWEWCGYVDPRGYGSWSWRVGSQTFATGAHRFAYQLLVGDVPDRLHLDHLCRNRRCVNPDHLQPVTPAENARRGIRDAVYSRRTHCKHGHKFVPDNVVMVTAMKRGKRMTWRECAACRSARAARKQRKPA